MSIWLVGCGPMARSYAQVLGDVGVDVRVVGRSEASAASFEAEVGVEVARGGLEAALTHHPSPELAIVSVGIGELADATRRLVEAGCGRVLAEKPGGLDSVQVAEVAAAAAATGADVLVAYNRRYYGSVAAARNLIESDGGVASLRFEFGERLDSVLDGRFPASVLRRWFLANSTHPVDLAFHLAGRPTELEVECSGGLDWHPSGSTFRGRGRTSSGATFGYEADWRTSGSWVVEVATERRRLLFQPLETLRQVVDGVEEEVEQVDDLDRRFKPGLHRQVTAFLDGDDSLACTIAEQVVNCHDYDRIAGYGQVR
ncbi:MAG: Gfo/Idh/MocA family oxidoreductase [Actinomycetota bacterium]|nr:Gfo/Idh/MocA family oxidoreductase [Actinomycetota bacterium]